MSGSINIDGNKNEPQYGIWQNCIFCKDKVNVDNCFGSISPDNTWCERHHEVGMLLTKLEVEKRDLESKIKEFDREKVRFGEMLKEFKWDMKRLGTEDYITERVAKLID